MLQMPESSHSHNQPEYSVSEISAALKRSVEDTFGYVRVRGELSGVRRPSSGHLYLDLKDDKSVLKGVCWKGVTQRLSFKPEDGLEVICTGKLTTYAAQSNYQLIIEMMEPAGAGALMAQLEKRKKQLAAEGLFDSARKQPLPFMPQRIGVVTSPTGAVIRDILHRIGERFPVHVLVWPVRVQGEGAAEEIAAAIRGFNAMPHPPELLIVARGGGSMEDLWCFNEEVVVRAVAASHIPLISAVGHETDTTLIDYASDLRAPTPTAAAEIAVPVRSEWMISIEQLGTRLNQMMLQQVRQRTDHVAGLARGIPNPSQLLAYASQRLDDWSERLHQALPVQVERRAQRLDVLQAGLTPRRMLLMLERAAERLAVVKLHSTIERMMREKHDKLHLQDKLFETLNYRSVLKRGYVLVKRNNGDVVLSSASLSTGDGISVMFHDGQVDAVVGNAAPSKPSPKKIPPNEGGGQSTLF